MNMKPGDWNCRSCQHLNFMRRDWCQLCGNQKSIGIFEPELSEYGSLGGSSFGFTNVKPGDWYCQCGVHNFASRSSCFKCGNFKNESGVPNSNMVRSAGLDFAHGAGRAGWKSGDWICNRYGCNEHNYASRMECFRCNAPRDYGA